MSDGGDKNRIQSRVEVKWEAIGQMHKWKPAASSAQAVEQLAGRLESMAIGESRRTMPTAQRPVWISGAE